MALAAVADKETMSLVLQRGLFLQHIKAIYVDSLDAWPPDVLTQW